MLRFIFVVLILSSLFRRPRLGGFPFLMGGWGYRRPPMGMGHRPPMGGMRGPGPMGGGFRGGPGGRF